MDAHDGLVQIIPPAELQLGHTRPILLHLLVAHHAFDAGHVLYPLGPGAPSLASTRSSAGSRARLAGSFSRRRMHCENIRGIPAIIVWC
jgi:hypothetical protein